MAENNNDHAGSLPPEPHIKVEALDRLVGRWLITGPEIEGENCYEWMEGGFFLIHRFDLVNFGQRFRGVEYAGHDVETDEIVVRLMGTNGSRFHYVWELDGNAYNAWLGDRGADNRATSRFVSPDRIEGRWQWPDKGSGVTGYDYVMERVPRR